MVRGISGYVTKHTPKTFIMAAIMVVMVLGGSLPVAAATGAAVDGAECSNLPVASGASPLVDAAAATGLNFVDRSWSLNTTDYNNDGMQDVLIGFHQHTPAHLMRQNNNCTFTWVSQSTWPKRNSTGYIFDRHKCTWGDFNGDGLQDSYCNGGRDNQNAYKVHGRENELNVQLASGGFVNMTDDSTANFDVGGECVRGRYTVTGDFNGDGWTDLFMGSEAPRKVSDPQCTAQYAKDSKVFINNGYGDGSAVGSEASNRWQGFHFDSAWNVMQPNAGQNCAVAWDYDHDGKTDLLACNLGTKAPYLFHNTGSGFVNTASSLKLTPAYDATVGDINNDGILDYAFSDKTGYAYRLGTSSGLGATVRLGSSLPSSALGSGVAIADINGDGLADIYGLADTSGSTGNPNDTIFMQSAGLNFTALTVPAAAGRGDIVAPLTLANGQTGFLVGNGKLANNGPYQFIIYNPAIGNITLNSPIKAQ